MRAPIPRSNCAAAMFRCCAGAWAASAPRSPCGSTKPSNAPTPAAASNGETDDPHPRRRTDPDGAPRRHALLLHRAGAQARCAAQRTGRPEENARRAERRGRRRQHLDDHAQVRHERDHRNAGRAPHPCAQPRRRTGRALHLRRTHRTALRPRDRKQGSTSKCGNHGPSRREPLRKSRSRAVNFRPLLHHIRLLPVLMGACGLLLAMKAVGISEYAYAEATSAAAATAAPAEAPKPKHDIAEDKESSSSSEVDLLTNLSKRRTELDARETELTMRENLIAAAEKRVDEKIATLKQLQDQIQKLVAQRD